MEPFVDFKLKHGGLDVINSEKLGIKRIDSSKKFQEDLLPSRNIKLNTNFGYMGSTLQSVATKSRAITVSLAFKNISKNTLETLQKQLRPDGRELVYIPYDDEVYTITTEEDNNGERIKIVTSYYPQYDVVITNSPQFKLMITRDANGDDAFSGTVDVQFTCYAGYRYLSITSADQTINTVYYTIDGKKTNAPEGYAQCDAHYDSRIGVEWQKLTTWNQVVSYAMARPGYSSIDNAANAFNDWNRIIKNYIY